MLLMIKSISAAILTATDIGGVWKVNMDGTAVTNVITDLYDPYGIALNVAGNKLYVADEAFGRRTVGQIYRTDLSGWHSIVTAVVELKLVPKSEPYASVDFRFGQ
jgi:sugar lactone lactonase YvrE